MSILFLPIAARRSGRRIETNLHTKQMILMQMFFKALRVVESGRTAQATAVLIAALLPQQLSEFSE